MLHEYRGRLPEVAPGVFLAPGCHVVGDVVLAPGVTVWFNAVVRGDGGPVRVGEDTNIQDNVTIHCLKGGSCTIGPRCSIGHNAVIHGAVLESDVLVGMGACIMDGAILRPGVVVGAGAVLPGGREYGRGLYTGVPAKWNDLTGDLEALVAITAGRYRKYAEEYT